MSIQAYKRQNEKQACDYNLLNINDISLTQIIRKMDVITKSMLKDCINMFKEDNSDNEVQRTMLQIVTELDGFDARGNIKVLMATNRPDTLDPAMLRPGRLDRKIEFPYPDRRQKRLIFQVITGKMNLSEDKREDSCFNL